MASQLDSEVKRGEEAEAQKSLLQLQIVQLGEQLEQLASGKQLPDGVTQDIRVFKLWFHLFSLNFWIFSLIVLLKMF